MAYASFTETLALKTMRGRQASSLHPTKASLVPWRTALDQGTTPARSQRCYAHAHGSQAERQRLLECRGWWVPSSPLAL